MAAEKPSILLEEPIRRMDGLFLWKLLKKYLGWMLLAALVVGALAGITRYAAVTPTYTVQVKFLIHPIRTVQDPAHEEWYVTPNPGNVNEGSLVAASATALLTEDFALNHILSQAQASPSPQVSLTKNALADMMTVSAQGQILTVSLSARDEALLLRIAQAVEQTVPTVMDHFYGVDLSLKAEQAGAAALALTNLSDATADGMVEKTSRNIGLFACLGGLTAAVMVFLIALARAYYDNRLYTAEDLACRVTPPVLGAIPSTPRRRKQSAVPDESEDILSPASPPSLTAAYEHLRLHLLRDAGESCPVYGFASLDRGSDTCLLATNVARSCAGLGKRVLLIHGNLRYPRLSSILPREKATPGGQENGLAEWLSGQCSRETACLRTGLFPGLDVISSGRPSANPSELLASKALGDLLRTARSKYDLVILDLPSLGEVSDALLLQPHLTGYILTIRAGHTHADALRSVCETLTYMNAPVTGFVLTDTANQSS